MSYRGGSHGDGARGGGGYSRGQSSGNFRGGRGSGAPRGGSGAPRGGSGAPRGGSGGGFARGGGSGHGRGGGSDYARGGQGRGRGFSSGDRGGRGAMRDIVDPNLISRDNINFSFNPSKIGSVKPEFVARKGHLAKELPNCRQIKLMTNHFAFGYTKDYNIYHYDFSWFYHGSDPDNPLPTGVEKKLGRADCYLLFDAVLQQHSHYFKGPYSVGYDGSRNVYSPYLLKCAGKDKRLGVKYIELEGLKGVFSVAFKLANTIELKSLRDYQDGRTSDFQREVIQALEVILKFPSRSEMVSLGRYAMFPVNQDRLLLSSWMELALGHRKSLRLSEIGLTLVVDRAATAFRKSGKAEDFLKYVISPNGPDFDLSRFRPNAAQMEVIRRAFLCLKVETSHLGFSRVYKVKDITDNSSDHEFFVWNEEGHNGEISVAEYFATKYRINLKYPNLPCLRAGKSAMIPIEICDIVANQHPSSLLTRLSPDEQAEMIRMTATPPDARFTCLLQAHGQIRQKISDTLDQFGLNIDIKPIGVTGVVLGPPKLIFHQNREVLPVNGKWDLRGNNFYKNKAFKKFGVINFCANPRDLDNFCEMFIKKAVEMKMMSGPSDPLTVDLGWLSRSKLEERKEGITAALRQMKASNCAFALCFFPPDKSIYNLTKRIADTSLLFPTQGVAPRNVKKISEQLMANILSKVNKKLGGINVILNQSDKPDLLKKKIMIIGADVTHPGEADELYSSVAASVSTYDKDHTMFYPSVRVQPKKTTGVSVTETIVDFRSMVQEHLDNFKATNNFLPDVILYLRDGVSEGQYASILTQEVNHLIRPYGTDGKYKPSVTAVIVSKRIQTRTRPVNPGDAVGKAGNVPPGTTIDSIITHPSDFDYFQYGHEGIQGTSRPCHYYLVHDDNNLNCAEMSKISFHLCHLFERCTRSTSAPAPIMHAHNLAYRARQWIVGSGEKKNLRGMTKEQRLQAETKLANQLNDRVKNIDINFRRQSMFFV